MSDLSLLYPSDPEYFKKFTFSDFSFVNELKLNDLVSLHSNNWSKTYKMSLIEYFTTSPDVISYRLEILEDLINHQELISVFNEALKMIEIIAEFRTEQPKVEDIFDSLYVIKDLNYYKDIIELLFGALSKTKLSSTGLNQLKKYINNIHNSDEYKNLNDSIPITNQNILAYKSVTIGVNLNERLEAIEGGIVSFNTQAYRSGDIVDKMLRCDLKENSFDCMTSLTKPSGLMRDNEYSVFNSALHSALTNIVQKGVRGWAPAIKKYVSINTDFIIRLYNDFRFYLMGISYYNKIVRIGGKLCKPIVCKKEDKKMSINNVFNPLLLLSDNSIPVSNDFQFDTQGMIYIVTGANQGGKSVFANAIGICQALFHLGLFVPGEKAEISPVSGIYTHFPVSNNFGFGKGRLGEECERLKKIIDIIDEYSLIICDEPFSSTSAIEAAYIAGEVITGLAAIGCRGLFVTHLHEIAQKLNDYNHFPNIKSGVDNITVDIVKDDNKRLYTITRGKVAGMSYASDIAKKYGLTLDDILITKKIK